MSREDEIIKLNAENARMSSQARSIERTNSVAQLIIGVVVILLGVAFLSAIITKSSAADLIPRQALPFIAFLAGVMLTGSGRALAGLGLMGLALLFILRGTGILTSEAFDQIWLIILVLLGLVIVVDARTRKTG